MTLLFFPLKNKKQAPTSPCCPRTFLSVYIRKCTLKPSFCSARRDVFLVVLPDSGRDITSHVLVKDQLRDALESCGPIQALPMQSAMKPYTKGIKGEVFKGVGR